MEVDALLEAGITPMITLHHFTHPLWFEEMGSFEKRENIEHFVNFCKLVFEEFSPKVKLWITIHGRKRGREKEQYWVNIPSVPFAWKRGADLLHFLDFCLL